MTTPSASNPARIRAAAVPPKDQTTLRVYCDQHEKLKIVASMERQSILAQAEAVLSVFLHHYDAVRGHVSADVSGAQASVPQARPTTTIRVSRALNERLKIVASFERRSIMDLTEMVFAEHLRLYEAMSGRTLETRGSAPTVATQLVG